MRDSFSFNTSAVGARIGGGVSGLLQASVLT